MLVKTPDNIFTYTLYRLDHTCFAESAIAVELDDADAEVGQYQIQRLFKDFN